MKSVIFLIIASHDLPVYKFMRDIANTYFKKMESIYNLKHFYVEFKNIEESVKLIGDTIYVSGVEERIENAIIKTQRALKYINETYEYDIVIRTNLSTFWNIPYLYELIDSFDTTNIATGCYIDKCGFSYITGTGIILSKDVAIRLCEYELNGEPEDIYISCYLKKFISIQFLSNNKWCLLMDGPNNKIPDDIGKILHFRIKSNDRIYDIYTFIILAKRIYDIDYIIEYEN